MAVLACPGISRGTGHCAEGSMFIDRRWASQIGNWLIRRFFFACRVAQFSLGSCWPRVDLSLRQMWSCLRHSADWMGAPKANDTDALNARMLGSPLLACFRIICSGLPAVVVCSSGAMCKVPFIQQQGNIHLIFLPFMFYTLLYISILAASHFVTPSLFLGTLGHIPSHAESHCNT